MKVEKNVFKLCIFLFINFLHDNFQVFNFNDIENVRNVYTRHVSSSTTSWHASVNTYYQA